MDAVKTEEECKMLLDSIEKNCRNAVDSRNAIKRLMLEHQSISGEVVVPEEKVKEEPIEVDDDNDEFEDEIGFYLSEYNQLGSNFTIDELIDILPSREHYDFKRILNRLLAESMKEIKQLKEFIFESCDLSANDLSELKGFIELENKKISFIRQILNDKEERIVSSKAKNRIILVPTLSGNIRIIDDIQRSHRELYDDYLFAIQSIINGTFSGVKRFTSNQQFAGFVEVRKNSIRIIFEKLTKDTYALVTAFSKKCSCDSFYRDNLKRKAGEYRSIEPFLKEKIDDPEFIKESDLYVEELFNLLSPKDGVKEMKKGDIND